MTWDAFMESLCDGGGTAEEKAAALRAVKSADVTGEMLAACAGWLLSRAVPLKMGRNAVDVCGTGGDKKSGISTFNISTAAAFVLASAGVSVIKHGNRAVSGVSGSSDVLEALGVPACATAEEARAQYTKHNLCFVAAPAFHPALKNIAAVRKSLGHPTFFNLLGPLCNPARTARQVIGVFDAAYLEPVAVAAKMLGKTDVIVVHAEDGLDEFSLSAPAQVCQLKEGKVERFSFSPQNIGIEPAPLESIGGGNAAWNAAIIRAVFEGGAGPAADIVCLNAAAGFIAAGRALDMASGFVLARQALAEGRALHKLSQMQGQAA